MYTRTPGESVEPDPHPAPKATSGSKSFDERTLKETLNGGSGISVGMIGRPATVVFRSAVQSTSVYVDELGNVSLSRGALPNPNIVIEGDHETLCAILQMRDLTITAPGRLTITVNIGTIRDFVIEISEGQEMTHPLKELYE